MVRYVADNDTGYTASMCSEGGDNGTSVKSIKSPLRCQAPLERRRVNSNSGAASRSRWFAGIEHWHILGVYSYLSYDKYEQLIQGPYVPFIQGKILFGLYNILISNLSFIKSDHRKA